MIFFTAIASTLAFTRPSTHIVNGIRYKYLFIIKNKYSFVAAVRFTASQPTSSYVDDNDGDMFFLLRATS